MKTTSDTRADTVFIGYLLIGFILLLRGVFGLQYGGLFGDDINDYPIDKMSFGGVCGIAGLVMVLLSIFAYRTGKGFDACLFTFFGLFFFVTYINCGSKFGLKSFVSNSCWLIFVALAAFFLILAVQALLAKTPRFVALLLALSACMLLFLGLHALYGGWGLDSVEIHKAMGIVYGIFGLLAFVVATYLGLAYADPKRIPLV